MSNTLPQETSLRNLAETYLSDFNYRPETITNYKKGAKVFDRFWQETHGSSSSLPLVYNDALLVEYIEWLEKQFGYTRHAKERYQQTVAVLKCLAAHEDAPSVVVDPPPNPFPGVGRASRPAEPLPEAIMQTLIDKLTAEAERVELLFAQAERLRLDAPAAPDLFSWKKSSSARLPVESVARAILEHHLVPSRRTGGPREEAWLYSLIERRFRNERDILRMLHGPTSLQIAPFFALLHLRSGHVPSSTARLRRDALVTLDDASELERVPAGRSYRLIAAKPRAGRDVAPLSFCDSIPDLYLRTLRLTERLSKDAQRTKPELADYLFLFRDRHRQINAFASSFDHGRGGGYRHPYTRLVSQFGLWLAPGGYPDDELEHERATGNHATPRRLRATWLDKHAQHAREISEIQKAADHADPFVTSKYLRTDRSRERLQSVQMDIVNALVARFRMSRSD